MCFEHFDERNTMAPKLCLTTNHQSPNLLTNLRSRSTVVATHSTNSSLTLAVGHIMSFAPSFEWISSALSGSEPATDCLRDAHSKLTRQSPSTDPLFSELDPFGYR